MWPNALLYGRLAPTSYPVCVSSATIYGTWCDQHIQFVAFMTLIVCVDNDNNNKQQNRLLYPCTYMHANVWIDAQYNVLVLP